MLSTTTFRDTPNFDFDAWEEANAAGCIEVTAECFSRTLHAQAAEETAAGNPSTAETVLEVLEDYGHAYVYKGKCRITPAYIARHALI